MKNPLQDKEFLYNLNQDRHKEIYAKIISLSFDEKPLEQIEGRVTSGSINIVLKLIYNYYIIQDTFLEYHILY